MSVSIEEIRSALSSVLNSKSLGSSPQLAAFLEYIVEETLQGNADNLKAYTIATCALGRDDSFDPQTDPIVRVQARRLRMMLDQYYFRESPDDKLKIELLPGSYVPNFVMKDETADVTDAAGLGRADAPIEMGIATPLEHLGQKDNHGPPSTANRLLVLDDEQDIRLIIRKLGESAGFSVLDAANANEFWVAYKALRPTLIVLDLVVPGTDGVEVLRELANLNADCQVILISGMDTKILMAAEVLGQKFGLEIIGSCTKPFDIDAMSELMQPKAGADSQVTADTLSNAIDRGELTLHLQPKISLADEQWGKLTGFEGLVRWQQADGEFVQPSEFVALAEKTGLIAGLTNEVVKMALDQLVALREDHPEFCVAVKMSPLVLTDLSLPDKLAEMAEARNVPCDRLIIEIAEAAAFDSISEIPDILARFRLKGFQLSVDNFGAGYASLMSLFKMPFNEIKIGGSFVQRLEKSDEARVIVKAIVGLARNLNLSTCAEGVETQEQAQLLADMGCTAATGPLCSEPVPVELIDDLIRGHDEATRSDLASIA